MLSNGWHYRRNNCDHHRNVGTIRKLAQSRETGGGARLAAGIEATNPWKAKLEQVATIGSGFYFLHCGVLSDCSHYRNVGTTTGSGQLLSPVWGTIGLWALSESWRTGVRLAAVIEAVARLAAVIESTQLQALSRDWRR